MVTQSLAVLVHCPETGRDIAQPAVLVQERNTLFNEGQEQVEIAGLSACISCIGRIGRAEIIRHVSVYFSKILELNVGRVADHSVEAPSLEGLRKSFGPVKGVNPLLLFLGVRRETDVEIRPNQAVAVADMVVKGRKRLIPSRRVEPESKLSDLDRRRIDVHAV